MTDSDIAVRLRRWATQIQVDTVDNASLALDLIFAAKRLEYWSRLKGDEDVTHAFAELQRRRGLERLST